MRLRPRQRSPGTGAEVVKPAAATPKGFAQNRRTRGFATILATALAVVFHASTATADVTIWLFPFQGQTFVRIEGSGTNASPGGAPSHFFSNLVGGDPFDASIQDLEIDGLLIGMIDDPALNLVTIEFDSDPGGANRDDLILSFDRTFSFQEDYVFATPSTLGVPNAVPLAGLDTSLLTPGTYTATDARFGDTTLLITVDPPPDVTSPAVPIGGPVGALGLLTALSAGGAYALRSRPHAPVDA